MEAYKLLSGLEENCLSSAVCFDWLVVEQVMASEDHRFLSSSLYSTGMLVGWDPAPYSSDLREVSRRTQPPTPASEGKKATCSIITS